VTRRRENTSVAPRRDRDSTPSFVRAAEAEKADKAARSAKSRAPRRRVSRLTKWLVSLGVLVTVLAFAAQWTLRQPYFRVQHVTFHGLRHEGVVAVLKASGLAAHPSMIGLSDATIKKNLSVFPWIKSVSITQHWPNSVVVDVTESVAVAVAFTAEHHLAYVDAQGRSLGPAPLDANLPTLEYLNPRGTTWPYALAGRGAAYVAGQLPRAFAPQVSVITDDASGDVTLKMTTPVTFVLGRPTDLHAKFVAIASVIAHSTLVPGDVVDVTVPDELAVTPPTS
jgi:cell division septal protein FtsQ